MMTAQAFGDGDGTTARLLAAIHLKRKGGAVRPAEPLEASRASRGRPLNLASYARAAGGRRAMPV